MRPGLPTRHHEATLAAIIATYFCKCLQRKIGCLQRFLNVYKGNFCKGSFAKIRFANVYKDLQMFAKENCCKHLQTFAKIRGIFAILDVCKAFFVNVCKNSFANVLDLEDRFASFSFANI